MLGGPITYKYKNFKYDNEINSILSSTILTPKDEEALKKIFNHFNSLNVNRGYKYIIKDLYILTEKKQMSTTDIASIYDVSSRTIQIWLKELEINRSRKQAQKIAVTKRDYKSIRETYKKTMFDRLVSTQLTGSLLENFIRYNLNILLAEQLKEKEYEVIIGINSLGILDMETDIPVIIIKNSNIYKFIIEVDGYISHQDNQGIERDKKKDELATNKEYKLLRLTTKAYFNENDDKLIYKNEVETKIKCIVDEILKELEA